MAMARLYFWILLAAVCRLLMADSRFDLHAHGQRRDRGNLGDDGRERDLLIGMWPYAQAKRKMGGNWKMSDRLNMYLGAIRPCPFRMNGSVTPSGRVSYTTDD
jgi:hypothetical protein